MEAARVLALRGFQVTLFEKESELGGALLLAAKPPHKEKIAQFIRYLTCQLQAFEVEIRCNTDATPELVSALNPYAVFVAAGASPVVPHSIPGIQGSQVYTASDVLSSKVTLTDKNIVLIGGGMTGLETAEYLASQGNRVSVYEMLPEVASGEHFQNIIDVEKRLQAVPQFTGHQLIEITADSCLFKAADNTTVTVPCDAVVLSMGMRPNLSYAEQFSGFPHYQVLGTNSVYSSIGPAVESGFMAAYQLD